MSSFNWESTIVDPFLSLDDSSLIPMLQDSYVSQPNPKSKDSSNPANPTHVTNSVSPPYTDSSPSPSSANEDNESRPNGDTDHTRKASVDDIDIDEQRPSLSPISPDNRPKRSIAPSRRKSGGERIHVCALSSPIERVPHKLLFHFRMNPNFLNGKSKIARRNGLSENAKRSTSKM